MSPDGSTKSPLPEEKLLKLIRGKGATPDAGVADAPSASGREGAAVVLPPIGSRVRETGRSWIRIAVIALGVVLALEAVILVVQALSPVPSATVPVAPATAPTVDGQTTLPEDDIPSLAASASHALFAPPAATSPLGPAAIPRAAPSGSAKQLASRLTLLGIVPGDPAQVIIEDAETKKTYFVTVGQSVVEGAVLEQVREHHVILDLQGEKIELAL